jgi:hypothetical protein
LNSLQQQQQRSLPRPPVAQMAHNHGQTAPSIATTQYYLGSSES